MSIVPRPSDVFDREQEWDSLATFAYPARDQPRLGLVYGRRRQGKSYLLRSLASGPSGMYHQAIEEERAPALARVGRLVARDAGIPDGGIAYADWEQALRGLIERAAGRPIVLDEFPYLLAQSPELPSTIQLLFDEARDGVVPGFRLLLCGSAISVMSRLLAGEQALRGRAIVDLVLRPFDFRQAAAFWAIRDPATAFLVHAVVGGTPGYRPLFDGRVPESPDEWFDWLAPTVFNPSHAMFREAEYILTEDPALVDRALYQSIIGAIAEGHSTRHAIATALRRDDSALHHPLVLLERAGFIRREPDVLLAKRPLIRVDDPFLRFRFAILRPDVARWEAGETRAAWDDAQPRLAAHVLGPHFEQLARTWTERFAAERTLGGRPSLVGFAQLNDVRGRTRIEIDVVALSGNPRADRPRVLVIGEARGGSAVKTLADLQRLERSRGLMGERTDAAGARLLLFGRSGFDRRLSEEAKGRHDVELIDLERLYAGD